MTQLKRLNLYKEKFDPLWDGRAQSIHDNMNMLSQEHADKVIAYLENGLVLLEFVSPTWDNVDPKDSIPHLIYSDGTYAWDGKLVHWVKKYKIRLPEEFIEHVSRQKKFANQRDDLDRGELLDAVKQAEPLVFE